MAQQLINGTIPTCKAGVSMVLAKAIGYSGKNIAISLNGDKVKVWRNKEEGWRDFDYRDKSVYEPIANILKISCNKNSKNGKWMALTHKPSNAYTDSKELSICLAAIGLKLGMKGVMEANNYQHK